MPLGAVWGEGCPCQGSHDHTGASGWFLSPFCVGPCGSASMASGIWLQIILWEGQRSTETGAEEMQRGLPAPSSSLSTDVSSPWDVPQLFGWFPWLGVVGRVAEQVLCPFCPLALTRQGLAELLAGTGSTELGPHWQHLLLYTTQTCKAALKFISGQHCLFQTCFFSKKKNLL